MSNFRILLKPFEESYSNMRRFIINELENKTDEELNELLKACHETTTTNCSWATYDVAPIVKQEIHFTLRSRNK